MTRFTNIFLLLFSFTLAQSDMELGIEAYNKRGEGSIGAIAQSGPISEAINHFKLAFKYYENELYPCFQYQEEYLIQFNTKLQNIILNLLYEKIIEGLYESDIPDEY